MKEFERVFHRFDEDGDGKISPGELQSFMKAIGEEISWEDAEDLVKSADLNADGLLEPEGLMKLIEGDEEEDDRELREAFRMLEMEGEGCITANSLGRMLSQLGTARDAEECRAMICRFDLNGDGVLSFEEFRLMMKL